MENSAPWGKIEIVTIELLCFLVKSESNLISFFIRYASLTTTTKKMGASCALNSHPEVPGQKHYCGPCDGHSSALWSPICLAEDQV